jgi:hypothetical protein
MSEYDEDQANPGDLRAALKKAKEELEAANKAKAELEGQVRTRTLAEEIDKRGLDPRVAALVPHDADVTSWLDTNGELFSGSKPASKDDGDPGANGVTAEEQAELEKQQAAEQGTRPANEGDELAKVNSTESYDELYALVKAAQRQ